MMTATATSGDDTATTQRHGPNIATRAAPRRDTTTRRRRRGDDTAGRRCDRDDDATRRRRRGRSAAAPQCPSQSLQPQVPLTVAAPPGAPHSRCLVAASLAHPLQPRQQASLLLFTANARGWVRTAVEAQRRRGDDDTTTTTRRQRPPPFLPPPMRGHDDAATTRRRRRQPRCRCSPGSQSLQPPRSQSLQCPGPHRSFRRRYSPSLAAAPSLQVPSQSLQPPFLTGLTAPLTQEDGWWRTTTRRPALVVGPGAERTEGDAHLQGSLFGAESGDGGADGGPLGAVRAKGLVSGLAGRRGGDAAGRGAVGRHRRPGRCGSAFGGAPVLRMPENQRSDQENLSLLEWPGWARRSRRSCGSAGGAGVPEAWGRTRAW